MSSRDWWRQCLKSHKDLFLFFVSRYSSSANSKKFYWKKSQVLTRKAHNCRKTPKSRKPCLIKTAFSILVAGYLNLLDQFYFRIFHNFHIRTCFVVPKHPRKWQSWVRFPSWPISLWPCCQLKHKQDDRLFSEVHPGTSLTNFYASVNYSCNH